MQTRLHTIAIPTIPSLHAAAGFFAVALLFDLYKPGRRRNWNSTPRHAESWEPPQTPRPAFCDKADVVGRS